MGCILLSHLIDEFTPLYGNTPQVKIEPYSLIDNGDSSNTSLITIHCHSGTHVDAPKHFIDDGISISDFSLEQLIFKNPVIVDCSINNSLLIMQHHLIEYADQLKMADCLLLRTGSENFRDEDKYRTLNPGIAADTIKWIRREYPHIRCIGIDTISISSYRHRIEGRKAHRAAFEYLEGSKPLLLVEDMKLSAAADSKLERIIIFPWQVKGVDSAPCTVVAKIKDNNLD